MHARLGTRPLEPDWQRVHAASDLAACLQQLRAPPWVRHSGPLSPNLGVHEVERRLRAQWRATVDEVLRWLPDDWQPVLQWLHWLPLLPALQKLARAGRASGWMRDDPVLAHVLARTSPPPLAGAHAANAVPAPLLDALETRGDVTAAWLAHWRTLWPPGGRGSRGGLESIVVAVRRTGSELAASGPAGRTTDATRALRAALLRIFRRHPGTPAAAVAYLGLECLDLLELRGALARRAALSAEAT